MADLVQDIAAAIGQPAPAVEPAPTPAAAPATPDPYEKYLDGIAPELRGIARPALEAAHKEWEGGATPKFQQAEQFSQFVQAMQANPKGTLAFIAQHYGVPLRFADEPAPPAANAQPTPTAQTPNAADAIYAELQGIRADDPEALVKQVKALDRLAQIRGAEAAAARVGVLERAQLTMQEQSQVEQLKRDYPDVDVERLLPQIRRVQRSVQERPYLAPDEALAVSMFKPLVNEVRRLRTQMQRPPADEARAQVAGPSVSTPAGAPLDLQDLTMEQLRAILPVRKE